jgi:hypothetical protein
MMRGHRQMDLNNANVLKKQGQQKYILGGEGPFKNLVHIRPCLLLSILHLQNGFL